MRACAGLLSIVLALASGAMLHAGDARADDGKPIDCKDTDMVFKAPGFTVTCKDYSDPTALSSSGGMRVEFLSAVGESAEQILGVADIRALGGIYLKRRGLEEDIHD